MIEHLAEYNDRMKLTFTDESYFERDKMFDHTIRIIRQLFSNSASEFNHCFGDRVGPDSGNNRIAVADSGSIKQMSI